MTDALDGARHDPRRLHATERLRVQERAVGEPGRDQTLEIVVDGITVQREAAPVLEWQVRAVIGHRGKTRSESRDEDERRREPPPCGANQTLAWAEHGRTA